MTLPSGAIVQLPPLNQFGISHIETDAFKKKIDINR
jgi:hypothetical protein